MKYYRAYNTKLEEIEGWSTADKKGCVEIIDEHNNFAFVIQFGKRPKISVFENSNRDNFGDQVFSTKI
jgi:hypothetical protein